MKMVKNFDYLVVKGTFEKIQLAPSADPDPDDFEKNQEIYDLEGRYLGLI